mgnify:CR=1 FL=1
MWVEGEDALRGFDLPQLTNIGGYFWVTANNNLEAFSAPSLTEVGGSLRVGVNTVMTGFALPALTKVWGDAHIYNNALLAQCLVDALLEEVESRQGVGGSIKFCDLWGCNNQICICEVVEGDLKPLCD